jgi:hypothetical protein
VLKKGFADNKIEITNYFKNLKSASILICGLNPIDICGMIRLLWIRRNSMAHIK